MQQPLSIWLLLDSRQPGGIESHVMQLAEGLAEHKIAVTVVFLTHYGDHPLRDALTHHGISTLSLDGTFSTLNRMLKRVTPNVIHTHGYKAGILGRLAANANNIPVLSTFHAGEKSTGKLAIYDWLDRNTSFLADKIYAVSPQIASRLPASTEISDNFVNTSDLSVSYGKQIAYVGRLSYEKGPDSLLRLARQFPGETFHIYGDGPMRESLENSAPSNLVFHGQQNDMANVWSRIGLLIMPSRHEGLPMAALEAMARGIPIQAYAVGALGQLINEKNGWLIEPNQMQKLASALKHWLDMSEQQKLSIKRATITTIQQRFSSQVVIPKIIAVYSQLASSSLHSAKQLAS